MVLLPLFHFSPRSVFISSFGLAAEIGETNLQSPQRTGSVFVYEHRHDSVGLVGCVVVYPVGCVVDYRVGKKINDRRMLLTKSMRTWEDA